MNFIKLLELFARFNIEVKNFSIKNDSKINRKIIKIIWKVNNPAQIAMVCQYIKKY